MNIKQIHMMVCRVWFHENVNVQCTDNMIKNGKDSLSINIYIVDTQQ